MSLVVPELSLDAPPSSDAVLLAELLKLVLAVSGHGVWAVDAEGRTVLVNDRMLELLGATRDQFQVGEHLDSLPPPVLALVQKQLVLRAVGVADEYEVQIVLPDGRRRTLTMVGSPRFDNAGRYAGAIATCTDVTEHPPPASALSAGLKALQVSLTGPLSLSPREVQVVQRLIEGDRVPEIARTLFVSRSTIRNHLGSVFRKTGVQSQQELITLLRQQIAQ